MNDRPYKATALIVEDFKDIFTQDSVELDLDISFGDFKTKERAEDVAKSAIVKIKDTHIIIDTIAGEYYIYKDDVIFKKIKESKKIVMGKPLNPQDKDSLKIIQDSLDPKSEFYKQYNIEEDMEIVDYDLEYFISHYQDGQSLQNVAYGYKKDN